MKNTILTILAAVALAFTAQAADEPKLYNAGEFQIEAFGQVSTADLDQGRGSYGFGLSYYVTEALGAGVRTSFDELSGHTFESVSPRLLWRIPVSTSRHAFYAFAGGTRIFHGCTGWSLEAGPGYEWRAFKNVGVYAEVGMRKEITGERRSTDTFGTGEAGIRVSF